MITDDLIEFAKQYTTAWCSQNAARVAAFFSEDGSLTINGDIPAKGRSAITAAAQEFMTAIPDMRVKMDRLVYEDNELRYYWTMIGTNTGPGGTGNAIRISGFEALSISTEGFIITAHGHFDEAEYKRQLDEGIHLG